MELRCDLGSIWDKKAPFIVNVGLVKLLKFFEHWAKIHDNSIPENVDAGIVENAAREKVESELNPSCFDSVTRIGSTIESSTNAVILGKNINELAFAFVSPLRTQYNSELLAESTAQWIDRLGSLG